MPAWTMGFSMLKREQMRFSTKKAFKGKDRQQKWIFGIGAPALRMESESPQPQCCCRPQRGGDARSHRSAQPAEHCGEDLERQPEKRPKKHTLPKK
jgi:hypothetical protein